MNLYEIRERLFAQKKSVFTLKEIARIIETKKKVASVYINRMYKKGLLFKIGKDKISTTQDILVISSQLAYPSYLSLTTALYIHNIIQQTISKIYVITPKKKKNVELSSTRIFFINVSPKLMFGYKSIKKGDGYILLSDLEKTIIDCLYFTRYCRLNNVLDALKNADIKKLEDYLSILNRESVIRRAGYLLDLLGIIHNLKRKNKTVYRLNNAIKTKGKFNSKWYLYINEELK